MNREDFVFTIGYQGGVALVDGRSKKKYGRFSLEELIENKLYKPAFRYALYSEDTEGLKKVASAYRAESGDSGITVETLKRLFGVFSPPGEETKTKVI